MLNPIDQATKLSSKHWAKPKEKFDRCACTETKNLPILDTKMDTVYRHSQLEHG